MKRINVRRGAAFTLRHLALLALGLFWLIPIIWLVCNSFSAYPGINIRQFFPEAWSLENYRLLLFNSADTVARFPIWFKNTLIIAVFSCIISSMFVLMVSYAISRMRFKGRKLLMNLGVIIGLFPGLLALIAVYFVLKTFGLTNNHWGLVLIYSASSGLGYLIAKGFFDTISETLSESARLEGASEAQIFLKIIIPLSKPIIVYTVISAFLAPWVDFVAARIILNSGISTDWTVAIGLYNMLDRVLINNYFARFCAGGVLVSIPISVLFVFMQKFYVEGITGGSVKG
ncbi:MAG: ABC transporter permease subunit [Oscillospiraceae bacterium]|nr:ABC transporter permease subunit [Oscillospiraceae bacterium]